MMTREELLLTKLAEANKMVDQFERIAYEVALASAELVAEKDARIAELETALDDLLMAIDLPGDHCELEQAKRRAEAAIAKARGGMR